MSLDHSTFMSPFSWRYGSADMRRIWSEEHKRVLMRRIWLALARAQQAAGLVTAEQVADLEDHVQAVDIDRAQAIERETRHDVMAEIQAYAEQCTIGGRIIHWGATSADITDNVDVLRMREASLLLRQRLGDLLEVFAGKIEQTAGLSVMAYTHIQPAEPTTLGYRFAVYAQDLLEDYKQLGHLLGDLRGKGLKGAVGTQASFQQILESTNMSAEEMEAAAMESLGLPYFTIATQTYTRQQDLRVQQVLAGIAASLHKFAFDFRLMQSPVYGEWAEPFRKKQVGSTAMPFKRNPISSENICSLARYVAGLPAVAWNNASQAVLERSLDDSANRRIFQAEGFLAVDEIVARTTRIVREMIINEQAIARNMAQYGPFAATERVLMALVEAGAGRQEAHEWLRQVSLQAWATVQDGKDNPLPRLLGEEERISRYLNTDQIQILMDSTAHTGTASSRAITLANTIHETITKDIS